MAPLEPWEKVLVDAKEFPSTDHGEIACIDCHQGVQDEQKEVAHQVLVARPSDGEAVVCQECHEEEAERHSTSLHATQQGYWTVLEARGAPVEEPAIHEMFGNHCASCHTSCGDCHVSQPASVGGGLLDGHNFTDRPPMSRTCTACHGSRVGNEYPGKNEGLRPDVHFRQERMTCIDCHEGSQLHGDLVSGDDSTLAGHRYEGAEEPSCRECHPTVGRGENEMHKAHGEDLACQVCHSLAYTSCDSCHVEVSSTTGNPFFETAGAEQTFLIGRNPIQRGERPHSYTLLRHVPIDPESFAFYGEGLLPNFDAQPTWRYTTPHNIQRQTPQTDSCNACHGNPDLFLTADKVAPDELAANQNVIVDSVPAER